MPQHNPWSFGLHGFGLSPLKQSLDSYPEYGVLSIGMAEFTNYKFELLIGPTRSVTDYKFVVQLLYFVHYIVT